MNPFLNFLNGVLCGIGCRDPNVLRVMDPSQGDQERVTPPNSPAPIQIGPAVNDSPMKEQLLLGDIAPDFTQVSTIGIINFYEYIEKHWCLFLAHPQSFTPVCTTELASIAKRYQEFVRRGGITHIYTSLMRPNVLTSLLPFPL